MTENIAQQDFFMEQAIALGEKGRLTAPPNPWVGAVVVREGKVVGSGFHRALGEPHAEVHALKEAQALSQGSTVYVTLEPCAHFGHTPPCVNALIHAKVKRVVIPFLDPNPLVNGKGVAALKEAGIEVMIGVGEEKARRSLAPYLHFHQKKRPFCLIKAALSLDGRIAAADGTSQWITGEEARADAHLLRARSQAILIGSKTALRDRPRLTVRTHQVVKQPLRVILDSQGSVPSFFDAKEAPVLFFTTEKCAEKRREEWQKAGYEVVVLTDKIALAKVLDILARRNVLQLLVEGGTEVHSSFVREQVADRLMLYFGNTLLGSKGKPFQQAISPSTISDSPRWALYEIVRIGDDLRAEYSFSSP